MFRHIVLTLDGSEYGERALGYGRDLAWAAGARIELVMVISSGAAAERDAALDPDAERRAITYLEEKARSLRDRGIDDVLTTVRGGDPSAAIVRLATDVHADLIVMSTQGVSADGDSALGSVALQVLKTAPCPVFTVRVDRPAPPRSEAEERWQGEGGANVG